MHVQACWLPIGKEWSNHIAPLDFPNGSISDNKEPLWGDCDTQNNVFVSILFFLGQYASWDEHGSCNTPMSKSLHCPAQTPFHLQIAKPHWHNHNRTGLCFYQLRRYLQAWYMKYISFEFICIKSSEQINVITLFFDNRLHMYTPICVLTELPLLQFHVFQILLKWFILFNYNARNYVLLNALMYNHKLADNTIFSSNLWRLEKNTDFSQNRHNQFHTSDLRVKNWTTVRLLEGRHGGAVASTAASQ